MNFSIKQNRAFTLIELLIVVLIIAILAAIAVPNFLEFQTRAKVSRAKADMRSLVTCIEAYYVDNNQYPLPTDENGQEINPYPSSGPEIFETKIPFGITTPISYCSTRFNEPFPNQGGGEDQLFHYSNVEYAEALEGAGGLGEFREFSETMFSLATARYYLLSHGPDLDHDEPEAGTATVYDPTNGTTSNGDLIYFGSGLGFPGS